MSRGGGAPSGRSSAAHVAASATIVSSATSTVQPEPITQSHGPGGGASLPQRSCAHAMRAGSGSRCSFCRIFARCSSASPARPSVSKTSSAPSPAAYRPPTPVPLPSSSTDVPRKFAFDSSQRQSAAAHGHTVPPGESTSAAASSSAGLFASKRPLGRVEASPMWLSPSVNLSSPPPGSGGSLTSSRYDNAVAASNAAIEPVVRRSRRGRDLRDVEIAERAT